MSVIVDNEDYREPTTELMNAIFEITNGFQKTAAAIDNAFTVGREQGFTDKQIGDLIREQMLTAGFNDRTIRRALPPTAKHSEKTNRKYADILSASSSESVTGPDGNEVEQETETPEPPIQPPTREQFLDAINEAKQSGEIKETVTIPIVEYEELREAARPQVTKASELPRHTSIGNGTTYVPHDRIVEVFIACKQAGKDKAELEFVWSDEGAFIMCNVYRPSVEEDSNDISKTQQENIEASH